MSNYHGENTMNFCYVYISAIEFYDGLYQKVLQAHISENTILLLLRSFIFLGGGNKAFKRNTIFNLTSL